MIFLILNWNSYDFVSKFKINKRMVIIADQISFEFDIFNFSPKNYDLQRFLQSGMFYASMGTCFGMHKKLNIPLIYSELKMLI